MYRNVNPGEAAGAVPSLLCCSSGHSAFQWPFFLQRKHLFSLRNPSTEIFRCPVAVCGSRRLTRQLSWLPRTLGAVKSCCTRGENQGSFRAAFLSSWAFAQVRLRCSFMAMTESTASVSLRPSSPICAIQLAATVSSRGRQCSSSPEFHDDFASPYQLPTAALAVHSSSRHQLSCQLFHWSEDHPG